MRLRSENVRQQLRALRLESEARGWEPIRPATRGDCTHRRPCGFVSCRHHTQLDVRAGHTVQLGPLLLSLGPTGVTCSLDVADEGEHTLEEVASILGLTREAVRVEERLALLHVRAALDGVEGARRCRLCGGVSVGWLAGCRRHLVAFALSSAGEAVIRRQLDLVEAWAAWVESAPELEGD